MNEKVRKYLIDVARSQKQFAYYSDVVKDCKLKINLEDISGRNELSRTLGEISSYELANKRPLLSSVVFYKNKNDHGDGFYRICEELGIGKASTLKESLFGFIAATECREFWGNDDNYNEYLELSDGENSEILDIDFFTLPDINFLNEWSLKVYDIKNPEHRLAKDKLLATVWDKTAYLGSRVVDKLKDFDIKKKRYWSQPGWNKSGEKNIQAAIFKPYTWFRIFKKGDENKDIFFTAGIDGKKKSFVYKLDYFFEKESKLTNEQKALCEALIPDELAWKEISSSDLMNYNWKTLTELIYKFIYDNSSVYDKIVNAVWSNVIPDEVPKNRIFFKEIPKGSGLSELPVLNPSFEGVEKDFIESQIKNKKDGDAGEQLVIEYEQKYLTRHDRADLADCVKKAMDGEGYDILSFDKNGNKKYIEVKTTVGNSDNPFMLSINELLFMRENKGKYFLYRLYNYNRENNTATFYIYKNDIESQILQQPIQYRVYKRKFDDAM